MVKHPVSEWIAAQRKAHGWKVEELSERLRGMGYEAEVGTIRVWEAGRKPKAETIEGLERLFGSTAPRDEPTSGSADVLRAIERQTEMLEKQWAATTSLVQRLGELVEEMRANRAEGQGRDEALVDILAELKVAALPTNNVAAVPPRVGREGRQTRGR